MQKIQLLLACAGVVLLCGCDKETQVKAQKIDVLTQKIFILQEAQAKQLEKIQSQLAALPGFLEKTEAGYYAKTQEKALFYHTNNLYLLLAVDKKIQTQFELAATARDAANAQAYYYHTNETDTAYFCAAQIADAMNAQEKRIEDNVAAQISQASKALSEQLMNQIKLSAPDKAQAQAEAKAEAARRQELEARLLQIQRDLDEIKSRLTATNPNTNPPPVVRP